MDPPGQHSSPKELIGTTLLGSTNIGELPRMGITEATTYDGPSSVPPSAHTYRYRLQGILGTGGQATAFHATRLGDGADLAVTIKLWRPSFIGSHPDMARMVLHKETISLARFNETVPPTPYIVRLLDYGQHTLSRPDGPIDLPWLALEYVHGGPLGTTLRGRIQESIRSTGRAFAPNRARRVLGCVMEGLKIVHGLGVFHRDIKPTNILLCGAGEEELAKLADFGVARPQGLNSTFGAQTSVGTPGYAAPEQLRGNNTGPWSDVFSAAALTYFVLTGTEMFTGKSESAIAAKVFASEVAPLTSQPHLHPDFQNIRGLPRIDALLKRATAYDIRKRVPSVEAFWNALEPLLEMCESDGRLVLSAASAQTLRDQAARPWSFRVLEPGDRPTALRAMAFDPDGQGVGITDDGLVHFDGTQFRPLFGPPDLAPSGIRVLSRLGPHRWFACGDEGVVTVFHPRGIAARQVIANGQVSLTAAAVFSEQLFAVCGHRIGHPPLLYAFTGQRWQDPMVVTAAETITDIAACADGSFLLTGVDAARKGVLLTYRPEPRALIPWPITSAALCAVTVRSDGIGFVVGAGGYAFRKGTGHPALERVMSHRDLSVVACDPADTAWAGAPGRILSRPERNANATWAPQWSDDGWTEPFVSLAALDGRVLAACRDGRIVLGNQTA